jgi:choice-of-anchor B domain-containing protein
MTLLGHWDDASIPAVLGSQYNDVWGYEAGGREYAIVGATTANYVIEVTNPSTPIVRAILNGSCASTRWRDHATYGNYLYTITDNCATGGLQVWDLSSLPAAPVLVFNSQAFFINAHTLFINTATGRLYVGGADTQPGGVLVLDLLGHPANPTLGGNFTLGGYTHDIYVHNDTLYAFFGSGGIGSFDLVNLANPEAMGYIWSYPESGFAHSGCGINNNKNLIWTDETAGKSMKVANITDPWNITFQSLFKSALLAPTYTNSIAHNPVAAGKFIYVSYYEDGLQIWDVSTPTAPVRVAYYDTQVNTTYNGFVGAWGVHPPLNSGKILVSDTQNGLYILQKNTPFPITLSSFKVVALQDKVRLDWTTQSELNNVGFVVERSVDGAAFESIQQLPGAGTSNAAIDYTTYDYAPLQGISYYRLKQLDADGNVTLSDVVSVDFFNAAPELTAYPSPAHVGEKVTIAVSVQDPVTAELAVYDMIGKRLYAEQLDLAPGQTEIALPTAQWASGTYLVELKGGKYHLQHKLLIAQ